MKNFTKIVFFVLCLGLVVNSSQAAEEEKIQEEKPLYRPNIEFLTGFGVAKLHDKNNYNVIPLFVDFDFNLKALTKKIGINPPSLIQFCLEPFVFGVSSPDSNAEVGNNFVFKFGILPETWKIQPYVKGGIGLLYMSQHTRAQGTQFNFNEFGGVGAHYFFTKNMAFTVEYRYRHISNAGIRDPNHGINTSLGTCGISYRFN